MLIVTHISELRTRLHAVKHAGKSIGFVPTMGALHEGHLSLVEFARHETDFVVASIFVNPQQFGPGEDFDRYPRQAETDAKMFESAGVDLLFMPNLLEVYPQAPRFSLIPGDAANLLCGKSRPGHFAGVGIVVAKLLNLVQPDFLFLGQKDLQQTVIIRQLIEDFNFPVELVVCPIVREADGLAMSSRNRYLSEPDRKSAAEINKTLKLLVTLAEPGTQAELIKEEGVKRFAAIPGLRLDYLDIVYADSLESVSVIHPADNPVFVVAAYLGNTRLIDNEYIFS